MHILTVFYFNTKPLLSAEDQDGTTRAKYPPPLTHAETTRRKALNKKDIPAVTNTVENKNTPLEVEPSPKAAALADVPLLLPLPWIKS